MISAACVAIFANAAAGQRVAVITPDDTESSRAFAAKLEAALADTAKVLDDGLARAAFDALEAKSPFNLTAEEAKRIGQSIGCEHFVLVRSAVQRRSSFERQEYYEASAQVFIVATRAGHLVSWVNEKHEASTPTHAAAELDASISGLASKIAAMLRSVEPSPDRSTFEAAPDPDTSAGKNLKQPIPFRRIKPEYTAAASLYDITATVDMMVGLDADGKVIDTEVTRWAGYGLDEAVDKAVRSMNWRPAEHDGKFVPMRFLVRYNFKKLDKK